MNTITFTGKNKGISLPSEVSEMNQRQWNDYIRLVLAYENEEITEEKLRIKLLASLTDLKFTWKWAFLSKKRKAFCMSQFHQLTTLVNFIFEHKEKDGVNTRAFIIQSIKNFNPVICGRYYGPRDGLQDCNFAEYRIAYGHLVNYFQTKNDDDLNRLVAVLYRRRKALWFLLRFFPRWDGNVREEFTAEYNPLQFEVRVKRIARIPFHIRYAVMLYFAACEDYLKEGSVFIEGKEISLSIIYQKNGDDEKSKSADKADIGLVGILYSLAESKVFGSLADTDKQNLWDILLRLYQLVKRNKEMYDSGKTV